MSLMAAKILVGFIVGVLIGLSGVGGGVLLLPMLIFGLRVPADRGRRLRRALQLLHQNSRQPAAPQERHGPRESRARTGDAEAFRARSLE